MDERVRFVADYLSGAFTMTDLCRRYGVSRPTGYQLVERYEASGAAGLTPRSRRPHTHPQTMSSAIAAAIVALRHKHPDWGPVKLLDRLRRQAPDQPWPAASTAGALLNARGLIGARRRRRPPAASSRPPSAMSAPNAVWTIDFKGEFLTRDALWCYPLTVMDGCTRYLLACRALAGPRTAPTRAVLTELFREYGLPQRIRSDNGVPFAGPTALARLSRLSVWWIHLGIVPELIQPGCPAQKRAARADAPDAQALYAAAAGRQSRRAAASICRLSSGIQRGAATRGARGTDAEHGVCAECPCVTRRAPALELSRAL